MKTTALGLVTAFVVLGPIAATPTAGALDGGRPSPPGHSKVGGLEVYEGVVPRATLPAFAAVGLDHEDVSVGAGPDRDSVRVEVVMNARQARQLEAAGVALPVKRVKGRKASEAARAQSAAGYDAYRSYSEPGGIRDELVATAASHPGIAQLVVVGQSVQGQDILAVRVTKNAAATPHGQKPAVLFNAAQHAREWITPEMVRRLMHHVLDGHGVDPRLTRLVDTRELWFLPVANPDGYDHTFTPGGRLWRKNLRDNDGDSVLTGADGVDPNRNFPTRWGYDDEGSSPQHASAIYRGPAPASEPETRALDALVGRVGFEFQLNYHSAIGLLLYGTGWQVNTPSPDDAVYVALAGTDENPAVPGYDPDLSAELYTTNGETTDHMHATHGTLAFTPEMSTCQSASDAYPDDAWHADDCISVFNFPDDERLIREEFERNIPFALSVAESAADPTDPVSAVGLTTPDFTIDPFTVSHGTTQPVAVVARRSLRDLRLNYSVNGGRTVTTKVAEWAGGERYGADGDRWFAEFRGTVTGTRPDDRVTAWFTGVRPAAGPVTSERFTYRVADDIGGQVLVLAAEDVTGASPRQGQPSAKYAGAYTEALTTAGYTSDVYDIDASGRRAPHHLGVLSHYRAVVWETGDDVIPRAVGQPAGTAAKLALDTELAVRDYLNEGGKLLYTGKYAGFAQGADGVYYYNPNVPAQPECTLRAYPCLPLFNDFLQYYLGAYLYVDGGGTSEDGPYPVTGTAGGFSGFRGTLNGPGSADNQDHTASFLTTSSFLPPERFPQFASSAPMTWHRPGGAPYDPYTGDWYLYSDRSDASYKRLTRTVDLTSGESARMTFRISQDIETDWDYFFVEARPVGTDDWTTLPDAGGHTAQDTGESCKYGWVQDLHPHLAHYMDGDCRPAGTTGEWHAATGNSHGWTSWSVDLSRYAGQQVEVSLAHASDWAVQGLGVFLDDLAIAVDGVPASGTSFESGLDGWTVPGPPDGSGPSPNDWRRTRAAFQEGAGVTTDDTVYTGFGVEGLSTSAMRADFVGRAMRHLLG